MKRHYSCVILGLGLALLAAPTALHAQSTAGALPESTKALAQGRMAGLCRDLRRGALFAADADRPHATPRISTSPGAGSRRIRRSRTPIRKIGPSRANESTPLMVGGVLYTSTSLSQVAAIDAVSGETKWVFDPKVYENGLGIPANDGWLHRGVAYWRNGDDERIVILTAFAQMIALDAKTGKPMPTFGNNGRIDLAEGLRRPVDRDYYTMSSPPVIVRGVIVAGSSVMDWWGHRPSPPGDVRGFDVVTGRLLWTFHTVAQAGEPGVETWEKDSWKETGNTNVWAPMSADEELGYVYLPVSTPDQRLLRRRSPRRRPLWRKPGLPRRGDRQEGLALSARASRPVGLRPAGRAEPDRHHGRRKAHQGGRAGNQAGLPLRVRSRHGKTGMADRGAAGAGLQRTRRAARRRRSRFRPSRRRSIFRACATRT